MITAQQQQHPSPNLPFALVRPQVEEVEQRIRAQARAFDPAVEGYVAYVCETSGKRIRPALVLLVGGATGTAGERHLELGVVLELIHIATLVHDDIIDGADLRRERPTANAKWGNTLTVLLGDSLFAHALTLATGFEEAAITRKIADAANLVCQGEIIQTQRRFDLQLSVADYLRIIEMKTAALFCCATELGATLSGAPEEVQSMMNAFGNKLGCAYQIYDDCLDLVGEEKVVGKTLGTDLAKGKLTLPILNLIADATPRKREKLNRMLIEKEPIDVSMLAGIADYEGAIEGAVRVAHAMLAEARGDLAILDPGEHAQSLESVTRYVDDLLSRCRL
ncbi:MAG: polyprenyl synthetase family protein [Verrucomicrobiales bacterium]